MGTLSIRENLYFSAALRLPSKMSHRERKMRVDKVVHELGLENVENSKVNVCRKYTCVTSMHNALITLANSVAALANMNSPGCVVVVINNGSSLVTRLIPILLHAESGRIW